MKMEMYYGSGGATSSTSVNVFIFIKNSEVRAALFTLERQNINKFCATWDPSCPSSSSSVAG